MVERTQVYFVSDVHLGLRNADPAERERRFVDFLSGIPGNALSVYLLGDIWDFWYEYRDVVPREGARVVAKLIALMDAGVQVFFFPGNHDLWCFSFFESLGMIRCTQPQLVQIGGKTLCLGHGDLLGGGRAGYSFMQSIFKNKAVQAVFSTLHPWFAFRLGNGWSGSNRKRRKPYHFQGDKEPLYRFALEQSGQVHIDYFIFGHFHDAVDIQLPTGARLVVLKDWLDGGTPHALLNSATGELTVCAR
ncbi:MAG: UDP-2,3-diacylglucosamine diphosphatase [Bacteroidales bacterium]|nr:UDP-2,3-diacylglucosamine diphosphatase [Bacteroidales bacterium]